jgi:acyl carrier protein
MPLSDHYQNLNLVNGSQPPEKALEKVVRSKSAAEIQEWLISHLATSFELDPHSIDVQQDFMEYGLNSIEMVNISGELEEYLGCRLDPTLILNHPNIQVLSDFLAEFTAALPGDRPKTAQEAQQILANIDEMSDEDVDKLLNTMLENANE